MLERVMVVPRQKRVKDKRFCLREFVRQSKMVHFALCWCGDWVQLETVSEDYGRLCGATPHLEYYLFLQAGGQRVGCTERLPHSWAGGSPTLFCVCSNCFGVNECEYVCKSRKRRENHSSSRLSIPQSTCTGQ